MYLVVRNVNRWADPTATPRFQPLTYTIYWVQYQLWGNNAAGYHAFSVLLHALNGVLLWTLLRRLAAPGAWLAAALFAIHPIQLQAVAWVSQSGTRNPGPGVRRNDIIPGRCPASGVGG